MRAAPAERLSAALLALALLSTSPSADGAPYRAPPLTGHVVDSTGALTLAEQHGLDERMDMIRRGGGGEIVAFIVGDLGDVPIEDVAYAAFNQWGIGRADVDNGVLLVIAPKDRKIRIETGKGVGGALTDVQSSDIIEHVIAPRLGEGHVAQAISDGTDAIARALSAGGARAPAPSVRPPLSRGTLIVAGVGAALFGLLLLVSSGFRGAVWSVLQLVVLARLFGGGGGGRSGSGGSGFSGGGGSSGGGGASGGF